MAFAENKIDVLKKIKATKSFEDLEKLRLYYLGKKGLIPEALKGLGSLSIEEKKSKGQELNIIKKEKVILGVYGFKESMLVFVFMV